MTFEQLHQRNKAVFEASIDRFMEEVEAASNKQIDRRGEFHCVWMTEEELASFQRFLEERDDPIWF